MTIQYFDITGSNGEPFWTITTASANGEEVYHHNGPSDVTDKLWISFTNKSTTPADVVLLISGSGFGFAPVLSGAVSGGIGWIPATHNGFKLRQDQKLYARVEEAADENKVLIWGDVNRVTSSF